jgi:hypothetical protein
VNHLTRRALTAVGAAVLATAGPVAPASAMPAPEATTLCVDPHDPTSAARGAGEDHRDLDHRDVSATEQRAIERRTDAILDRQRGPAAEGATIPVYVHVMRDSIGNGDVTGRQIAEQIAALNRTFSGGESSSAADTGYTFALVDTFRYDNDQWHRDRASTKYRALTRRGGSNALNIWLVDFGYLGIATFPWDYRKHPDVDGVRVNYDSLPGGSIPHYNLGETATHEVGHWLGLYHTFQGGCTTPNDEVDDTPAQSGPTSGCPEGRDSCDLPGLDPIHNYMDYSFDSCYTQFTPGQDARMDRMWTAYRG